MSSTTSSIADDGDNMKILLATDIHLGYNETHPTRADDSFIAFEEILKIGLKYKVDFILLGGDLFHDGRPSVNCLSRCMDLLNRYCMGDGEVKINVLSDPAETFSFSANPMVNYMNPNLNVALPIFSIHGNHDDPLGYNAKCSLDMLSAAGLINYFGKYTNLQEDISMMPLLISKGNTKVSIYGLGALKDKMATRLFRQEKVNIMQPEDSENWFSVMVVHQNRNSHTKEECLQECYLPESMDLIFWGHEHECRIKPEYNNARNFYVTQPGSSVVTSLCEGESQKKHVGILHVRGKKFTIQPIPLKTVRPFVFDVVDLATEYRDKPSRTMQQGVQAFLEQRVEDLLEEAKKQLTGHPKQPTLPLIRLRVDCFKQDELFNTVRFGLQFEDKVANPTDMIAIKRPKQFIARNNDEMDQDAFDAAKSETVLHNVEELVEKYFGDCEPGKRMQVLPVVSINEALAQQMKGDHSALDIVIKKIRDKVVKKIVEKGITDEDEIQQELVVMRDENGPENAEQMIKEVKEMLDQPRQEAANGDDDEIALSDDDDPFGASTSTTRGRGRGARGTRARARGRGAARGRQAAVSIEDDEDEISLIDDSPAPARPSRGPGSRGGRGSRSRGAKAAQAAKKKSPPPSMNITKYTKPTQPGNRMTNFFNDDDSD